jgi:hypothetical protein
MVAALAVVTQEVVVELTLRQFRAPVVAGREAHMMRGATEVAQ